MSHERKENPQEEKLGRKPSEVEAQIEVFEDGQPNTMADVAKDGVELPPEITPNPPGFEDVTDHPNQVTRRTPEELPEVEKDLEGKNESRPPERDYGVEHRTLDGSEHPEERE